MTGGNLGGSLIEERTYDIRLPYSYLAASGRHFLKIAAWQSGRLPFQQPCEREVGTGGDKDPPDCDLLISHRLSMQGWVCACVRSWMCMGLAVFVSLASLSEPRTK